MTKENVLSGRTVINVGMGTPGVICAVLALNSLQKSIDFTPRAPRAGPTGGVGAALPAAINRRYKIRIQFKLSLIQLTTTWSLAFAAACLDIKLRSLEK